MAEFRVDTDQLAGGEGTQTLVSGWLETSAGMLRATAAEIAGAAGHAGASAAGDAWGVAWGAEMAGHAEAVRRSGRNVAAAASAYRETDEGQMRG
ncbi:MAG: hypothetical protein ACR2J6_08085 [Thermoleophilaceae bacterium]